MSRVIEIVHELALEDPSAMASVRVQATEKPGVKVGEDLPVVELLQDEANEAICLVVENLVPRPKGHPAPAAVPKLSMVDLAKAFEDLPAVARGFNLVLSQSFETTPNFSVTRIDFPILGLEAVTAVPGNGPRLELELFS